MKYTKLHQKWLEAGFQLVDISGDGGQFHNYGMIVDEKRCLTIHAYQGDGNLYPDDPDEPWTVVLCQGWIDKQDPDTLLIQSSDTLAGTDGELTEHSALVVARLIEYILKLEIPEPDVVE